MKGWRTLAFNIAAAVLTVVVAFNWHDTLPAAYAWATPLIIAVANIGLRVITDTPVGQPE